MCIVFFGLSAGNWPAGTFLFFLHDICVLSFHFTRRCSSVKNEFIETAVGFDTATKVAGQIAGNNACDGASAKKCGGGILLRFADGLHMKPKIDLDCSFMDCEQATSLKFTSSSFSDLL